MSDSEFPVKPRRRFIGAASGAVALGFPLVAAAKTPLTMRWQSSWPAKDIFHEYALDFAARVNAMSGGRLKIEMLPAGAVVKAFDLIDAVSRGRLDGGHGVVTYWYGKNSALGLWGSGAAFGMDANTVLAWHHYGGGRQLLDEIYKSLKLDVVSFIYGPMPTQPFGWFRKPIRKLADLRGLKFRTVGLAAEMYQALGMEVNPLPAAEIVPALDRGIIDAAEFNNATSDLDLGLPDVARHCLLQSFHQGAEQFEVVFNRPRFEALPEELRAIIRHAVEAASADMSWKAIDRYSRDYEKMLDRVSFEKTPDELLRRQLEAWERVVVEKSAENPMFRKVSDSMRAFAARAGRWQHDTLVDQKMAYRHFFQKKVGVQRRKKD
jgi:TRAP-type mannitol/chloroaromatic compound transport system substrate-binding protein